MVAFLSRCLAVVASLTLWAQVQAEEECTHGRLFVSDHDVGKIHVLDLDGTTVTEAGDLDVPQPQMRLYASETTLARVVAVYRGDGANQGTVQTFNSGLSGHAHGSHMHIEKEAPSKLQLEVTSWRPTHITFSAGYLGIFNDGVWTDNTSIAVTESSAQFVKEAQFGASSTVTVPVAGAHHGVAVALADDRFLVTQTTSARLAQGAGASALPDHFVVADASGTTVESVGDDTTPSCPGYHGASYVGDDFVFGCSAGGLLRIHYHDHGGSSPLEWNRIPYPSPVGSTVFRSGTVKSSKAGGVFATDLYDVTRAPTPRYVMPLAASATSVPVSNLVDLTKTGATERTDCSFVLDRMAQDSGGALLAILHEDGKLTVVPLSATGVPGTPVEHDVLGGAIDCGHAQLVAGYGMMHVLVGNGTTNKLVSVDLEEFLEGHMDHAMKTTMLSFTPKYAALSLPSDLVCMHEHDHDHESSTTTVGVQDGNANVATGKHVALLQYVAFFLAALAGPLSAAS